MVKWIIRNTDIHRELGTSKKKKSKVCEEAQISCKCKGSSAAGHPTHGPKTTKSF